MRRSWTVYSNRDEAAGYDLIQGELLIGDACAREYLLDFYYLIHRLPSVSHPEVAAFVRAHKLHGRGIGWTDAHLLASALVAGVSLWTAGERLTTAAGELGAGHSFSTR